MGGLWSTNEHLSDEERKKQVDSMYGEYREGIGLVEEEEVKAEEVLEKMGRGEEVVFVDCRNSGEYAVSTIEGSLLKEKFEEKAASDPSYPAPDALVVMFCTVGYRSGYACKAWKEKGGRGVVKNLEGSVLSWLHAGGELVEPVDDWSEGKPATGPKVRKVHTYAAKWDLAPKDVETVQYTRII